MPLYEYYCPENHTIYTFLARRPGMAGVVPRCPDNPEFTMQKRVSGFAVVGVEKKSGGEEGDAAMESALAGLEAEFAGMDEENPDPRQLARLMRRMGEVTGEDLGGSMEEMISRLERGEDPEALEEEFGDALDEPLPGEAADDDPDAPEFPVGTKRAVWERLRKMRSEQPPRRDATVYDMAEFLPEGGGEGA